MLVAHVEQSTIIGLDNSDLIPGNMPSGGIDHYDQSLRSKIRGKYTSQRKFQRHVGTTNTLVSRPALLCPMKPLFECIEADHD